MCGYIRWCISKTRIVRDLWKCVHDGKIASATVKGCGYWFISVLPLIKATSVQNPFMYTTEHCEILLWSWFLWMNVWVCPPVAAVDPVKQTRLVTVSTTLLCTRQAARCRGVGFAWQPARLSAACLCGSEAAASTALSLSLSLSYTLRQTLWPHTHTVMVSFFPFSFTHTQPGLIFSFAFHSLSSPVQTNPLHPGSHGVLWPY